MESHASSSQEPDNVPSVDGMQDYGQFAASVGVSRRIMYDSLRVPFLFEYFNVRSLSLLIESFLWYIVVLPLRSLYAVLALATGKITTTVILDIVRSGTIVLPAYLLLRLLDIPTVYHFIRSQSLLKVVSFMGMLDVVEKLIGAFGVSAVASQLHSAHALAAAVRRPGGGRVRALGSFGSVLADFIVATIYVTIHAFIYILRLTCLQAALNSSDNSLLSLIITTSVSELRLWVFKRVDPQLLMQISLVDVYDMFMLIIYTILLVIQGAGWRGGSGVAAAALVDAATRTAAGAARTALQPLAWTEKLVHGISLLRVCPSERVGAVSWWQEWGLGGCWGGTPAGLASYPVHRLLDRLQLPAGPTTKLSALLQLSFGRLLSLYFISQIAIDVFKHAFIMFLNQLPGDHYINFSVISDADLDSYPKSRWWLVRELRRDPTFTVTRRNGVTLQPIIVLVVVICGSSSFMTPRLFKITFGLLVGLKIVFSAVVARRVHLVRKRLGQLRTAAENGSKSAANRLRAILGLQDVERLALIGKKLP